MGFPALKTVKELRGFLNSISFHKKFIPGLRYRNSKNSTIPWTIQLEEAFTKTKRALARGAKLSFPNHKAEWALCTDAYSYVVGAVRTWCTQPELPDQITRSGDKIHHIWYNFGSNRVRFCWVTYNSLKSRTELAAYGVGLKYYALDTFDRAPYSLLPPGEPLHPRETCLSRTHADRRATGVSPLSLVHNLTEELSRAVPITTCPPLHDFR